MSWIDKRYSRNVEQGGVHTAESTLLDVEEKTEGRKKRKAENKKKKLLKIWDSRVVIKSKKKFGNPE